MLATPLRLIPFAVVVLAATAIPQDQKPSRTKTPSRTNIPVQVDPRIELMSVIFRLAGNPEYNRGRVDVYTSAVDEWFEEFKDHEAVRAARTMRRTRGVSFDAVMNMAVHIKDAKSLKEAVPFKPRPASLEKR